jgi:DnaK suppressor protein
MELTDNDLNRFKLFLLNQKADLLKVNETAEQAEGVVELDQTRVGRLSRMDAMQVQAMSRETGRRRRQTLLSIDAALERLESGEYGLCFECGEIINPDRLRADPIVTHCISCAEALE